jgi:O-acetyl-ADP-ribose deacetylase (regulator of RNase III)
MNKRIEIIQADITTLTVDAIVNAANSSLMGGGGVDGAIHRTAGPELKEECRPLRGCKTGFSKITKGYNLPSKHIIHTVGPVWYGGDKNEEDLLRSCYQTSMELMVEHSLTTIAFPSISTGAYRFPFDKACKIALETINDFLNENDVVDKVYIIAFGDKDFKNYNRIYNGF